MSENLALVGSETLLGRELRDLLADDSFGADVRLIAGADDASGVLSEHAGEPALLARLEVLSLADADLIVLAGDPASSRLALELALDRPVIDLTYQSEDHPRSRLRAPMVEPHDFRVAPDALQCIAHPASIALALLLNQLQVGQEISNWVAHIFEPASERGTPGIQELQEQTVNLLSFKPLPKKIFDVQAAFAMLAGFGEEAPTPLEEIESRIERHLATLLQNAHLAPMPSLRLVQAPAFHGYSISVWVEFASEAPDVEQLEARLASENVSVYGRDLEPPNNVGIAGQDGISVGAIKRDRNNPRALWLWVAADNLRLSARNALAVAREIL